MKNIVYAYYSKDLSVKVKTAKMQKMKRGEFQGGRVPYGLIKDPNVKGKLIVDPEAAKVVKEIFGYAIQGSRLVDIAETLNKKGYETPSAYYRRKHPESKLYANTSPLSGWTIITVEKIIEQEMYYGAIVQHKREGLGVGRKHTRKVPKEEQIIVTDRLSCPRIALPSCPPTAQLTVRGRACFAGRVNLPVFLSNTPDNH